MDQPSAEVLADAANKYCRDIIRKDLRVLFCGINPSLMTAAVGHHFARPGNRFWKTLAGAKLTPRLLDPEEDGLLPGFGLGITNLVDRATRAAAELSPDEFASGWENLQKKIRRYRPENIAFLGIGAYRLASGEAKVPLGRQENALVGARVWVLPNPSGLNAHYQLPELIRLYSELADAGLADAIAPAVAVEEEQRSRSESVEKPAKPVQKKGKMYGKCGLQEED
ncbi:MAG: G/U mismatch-specific DNA glycosylase [Candidatus Binatia bacterium]|nr:G/U mismatch-specific DNA glycosylase [Candidatus Binatia bacterium]MDG1959882.1 G/U mismatch-specific DNA glycosylase [Candidatus Binatia bacterium]MDG2010057.1 G/U mismatch-specific DNA glycosylase [Candidatus Binatia bacterium]HAC79425.1 G/U mismatch-specific DNA glycosylase [Deltaproteobacteria bacterium]